MNQNSNNIILFVKYGILYSYPVAKINYVAFDIGKHQVLLGLDSSSEKIEVPFDSIPETEAFYDECVQKMAAYYQQLTSVNNINNSNLTPWEEIARKLEEYIIKICDHESVCPNCNLYSKCQKVEIEKDTFIRQAKKELGLK